MDFALCTRYDERTTRTSLLGLHTAGEYSTEFRGQQWKRSKAHTLSRDIRWAQYQAGYALGTIQYVSIVSLKLYLEKDCYFIDDASEILAEMITCRGYFKTL